MRIRLPRDFGVRSTDKSAYDVYTGELLDPKCIVVPIPSSSSSVIDVDDSWFHQGRQVGSGNEVSHSKLASIGALAPPLPARTIMCDGVAYTTYNGFLRWKNSYNQVWLWWMTSEYTIHALANCRPTVSQNRATLNVTIYRDMRYQSDHNYANGYYHYFECYLNTSDNVYSISGNFPSSMVPIIVHQAERSVGFDLNDVPKPSSAKPADSPRVAKFLGALASEALKYEHLCTSLKKGGWSHTGTYFGGYTGLKSPQCGFVLDEPSSLLGDSPIMVPYGSYHLASLKQAAYLDALERVPSLNDNSLANVAEICSVLRSLVFEHRIEIPDNLAATWLSYRYQYSTTKMDVQEGISYLKRASADLSNGFSCYGSATGALTKSVQNAVVKCKLSMRNKELTMLNKVLQKLFELGLSPSFYVFWDMLPYSFVVDWFLPVGDILHAYDMDIAYHRDYSFDEVCYSLSYDNTIDGNRMHQFTRWYETTTPNLNGFYTLETADSPAGKIIGFRILDAMSLVFTR